MNYKKRRDEVLSKMEKNSVLVLYSGVGHHVSADEYAPFEANRNFFYLTGIRRENMMLILDNANEEPTETLLIEEADPDRERWMGKKMTVDEAKAQAQIEKVGFIDTEKSVLNRIMTREDVYNVYFDTYRHDIDDLEDYNMMKARDDLAFQTVKLGQTSFPELAASMGAVVPLASTLKVSQEELFGAMATLTGVTGSTSEVTTQLKATMQGFMSPSNEMSKALKKMGYSSGAAALESEGLGSILKKLKDSVKGDEVAFAAMFSSVEAKNAVLALAGTQAENFATKTDAMNTASGAADEAFKRQTSSVKEMAARIKNSGSVILTSLGERALPVLEKGLSVVADYMPQFESAVTGAADAVGPAFNVAGGAVAQLWDNWQPRLSELAPLVSSTMNNVASGIQVALPVVSSIFEGIGGVASAVLPTISAIAQDMGGKVSRVFSVVGQHTGTMQSIFAAAGPAISSVLSTSWSVIGPILDLAIEGFNLVASVVGWAFPYIQSVITSVWSVVGPVVTAIGSGISAVAGAFKKAADSIGGSAIIDLRCAYVFMSQ